MKKIYSMITMLAMLLVLSSSTCSGSSDDDDINSEYNTFSRGKRIIKWTNEVEGGGKITTSYIYDYEVCYSKNNCTTKKDVASIDYTKGPSSSTLLVLGYDFDLDDSTAYAKYRKNNNMFFNNFASVKAGVEGVVNEYSVIDVTPKNLKNKLVLQVNGNIKDADDLDLYITIRNKRYIINLI